MTFVEHVEDDAELGDERPGKECFSAYSEGFRSRAAALSILSESSIFRPSLNLHSSRSRRYLWMFLLDPHSTNSATIAVSFEHASLTMDKMIHGFISREFKTSSILLVPIPQPFLDFQLSSGP